MNRSGFGARGAKSLASTSNGKRDVVDVGPDRIIRAVGGDDITLWLDSTDPRLSSLSNGAGAPIWYDKSKNEAHMRQTDASRQPTYTHNAANLNGRPCISAIPARSQDYTGSAVSWSADCYTMMVARRGADTAGYFFSQEAHPFDSGDMPNISFLIRSDGDSSGGGGGNARFVQSAIGYNTNPPGTQLQIKAYNYFTYDFAPYNVPHITNLEAASNSNKFGLVHMTWEIQSTSSATRTSRYNCPAGCTGSAAVPINCYNKDFTISTPGALYGPGNTNPLRTIQGDATKPDGNSVELLETMGWGDMTDANPPTYVPEPRMFVHADSSPTWAAWDTAFFLGMRRIPQEGALRRLEKAILHKFGSNCYDSGYNTTTDTDSHSDIL